MSRCETILYTPYYRAASERRQAELDRCLRENVACREIDRIVLLIDDGSTPPVDDPKIELVSIRRRPSYGDWLELAARRPEHYAILANTDIYFDETLAGIGAILDRPNAFIALSRWEEVAGQLIPHRNPHWSQDVWAIRSTGLVHRGLLQKAGMIRMGIPRCDNKIAYLFAIHGYEIHNPMNALRSVHVHESEERGYDKKRDVGILGGVAYVHPSATPAEPAKLEFDVWSLNVASVQKVALNKSLHSWHGEEGIRELMSQGLERVSGTVPVTLAAPALQEASGESMLVYSFLDRFQVWRHGEKLEITDNLWKTSEVIEAPEGTIFQSPGKLRPEILYRFFPVWERIPQFRPDDRPRNRSSVYFWQYPCITEKQAYLNSLRPDGRTAILDGSMARLHLPVPWATLIDKKADFSRILRVMTLGIAGLKALLDQHGISLQVHTVCQQIHWRRIVREIRQVGVTHLHVSHLEEKDVGAYGDIGLSVHSWPLYAVNVEDPERRDGLAIGRKPGEKKYLATFIGAYRPAYRSDARLAIQAEAQKDGGHDVLVEIANEWHYEKVVYGEQVAGRTISVEDRQIQQERTRRYNELLSDSVFSLCPDGTGPNTLRLWESLAVGSIPVIIADGWVPPEIPESRVQLRDVCVFVRRDDVDGLFRRLRAMSAEEIRIRHEKAMELYRAAAKMSPIAEPFSAEFEEEKNQGGAVVSSDRSIHLALLRNEFKPSYVWPNKAFPFREYYSSGYGRIFIIENFVHNYEWLSRYRKCIRQTDIFFVILGCYHHDSLVEESARMMRHLRLSMDNFIVLFNCEDDRRRLSKYGFKGCVVNQNAWLDENLVFRPIDISKKYHAVYVGRRSAVKRHYLAGLVPNLALVAGNNHGNAIMPVPDHVYLNDKPLTPEEVCVKINESYCGLILSEAEGACFASSEYLLCGVPVVSTKSKGGRDVWYDSYNSVVCEATPRAVADAVAEFVNNPRDPLVIRNGHIRQANEYRQRFIELLAEVLEKIGDEKTNAADYFREHFIHKMRKSYAPDFSRIFSHERISRIGVGNC
jgi:glycosyltransferase involved in cell wall biosynthesis